MRYAIDFLMKHNIAFYCPWFSAITLTHTTHAEERESIESSVPRKVKHPAIYQHWISKSKSLPISSECCDFDIFVPFFIFFFYKSKEKRIDSAIYNSSPRMLQLCAAFGIKRWGWKRPTGQTVHYTYISSHSVDHSLWLRLLWAAKCGQSASDNTCCQLPAADTKTFQPTLIPPLVKIRLYMQIMSIATRKLSHPLSNSQWAFTEYYTGQLLSSKQIIFSNGKVLIFSPICSPFLKNELEKSAFAFNIEQKNLNTNTDFYQHYKQYIPLFYLLFSK